MKLETEMTVNFHLKKEALKGKVKHFDCFYLLTLNAGQYQGVSIFIDKEQAAPAVGTLRALAKELEQALTDSLGIPPEEQVEEAEREAACRIPEHCTNHGLEEFDGCLGCASAAAVRRHQASEAVR